MLATVYTMIYLTILTPGNILVVGHDFPTLQACEQKRVELEAKNHTNVVVLSNGECEKRNVDEGFALQVMPDEVH
jgi:hypothetical protein